MSVSDPPMLIVEVALDKTRAELVIPEGCPAELLTSDSFGAALQMADVIVDEDVLSACAELARQAVAEGCTRQHRGVVARCRPPIDGADGSIEWRLERPEPPAEASYYERCSFTMVKQGQEIAAIIEPTAAQDGCDVTGRPLPAKQGKPAAIRFDDSILLDARQVLIAQVDGAMEHIDDMLRIRNVLQVADYVDFSTGNIEFGGDVMIGKGVRDCFTVTTTGNVHCDGVIEAATIDCGGDLVTRGMAGRDRGAAKVGRKLVARYLDSITAEIGLDLCAERSIVNCNTLIHGALDSPRATIIGGRHVVTGAVKINILGSPANVPTELVVGTVPRLDPFYHRLRTLVPALEDRLVKLNQEYSLLLRESHPSVPQKKRLIELRAAVNQCRQALQRGAMAFEELEQRIAQLRRVHVEIGHLLHLGVAINIAGQQFRIREDLKGPLSVEQAGDGHAIIRSGGVVRGPLATFADFRVAA